MKFGRSNYHSLAAFSYSPQNTRQERKERKAREEEAIRTSHLIDAKIEEDRLEIIKQNERLRVLLLGQSGSGKHAFGLIITSANKRLAHYSTATIGRKIYCCQEFAPLSIGYFANVLIILICNSIPDVVC